jgi:putative FmdB family regulatory protein
MPIFEYGCAKCGRRAEQYVGQHEVDAPPKCPKCGTDMEKTFSVANFKGEKDWNTIDIKKGAAHGE